MSGNHDEGRPPRLRKPWSSGMRMTLIGLALLAASLLYSMLSGGDEEYVGPSADGPTASDVMNYSLSAVLVGNFAMAAIVQQGATLDTGFGPGWTSRRSGRQIQFRNAANTAICQSLVMPVSEYRGYVGQFGGSYAAYKRAEVVAGMEASGATVTIQSSQAIPRPRPNWQGIRLVVRISSGQRYTRRTHYSALSTNSRHAAMLSCAYVQDYTNDPANLLGIVRAYGLRGS